MEVGLCSVEYDALNGPVQGETEASFFPFWAKVGFSKPHSSAETVFHVKPYLVSGE